MTAAGPGSSAGRPTSTSCRSCRHRRRYQLARSRVVRGAEARAQHRLSRNRRGGERQRRDRERGRQALLSGAAGRGPGNRCRRMVAAPRHRQRDDGRGKAGGRRRGDPRVPPCPRVAVAPEVVLWRHLAPRWPVVSACECPTPRTTGGGQESGTAGRTVDRRRRVPRRHRGRRRRGARRQPSTTPRGRACRRSRSPRCRAGCSSCWPAWPGARRILEVGTLGGYSTICLARALPPGGAS